MNENKENLEKETLTEGMIIESKESLLKKREKWLGIFERCPELSDRIINIFNDIGEDGMRHLDEFIMNGFSDYYAAATGLDEASKEKCKSE